MCGEYGEDFQRPHYHAIIFGINFEDRYPWRKNHSGNQLFRSPKLELLWRHGNCELGAVTFQSAAYVARYVMKKITGDLAQAHYTWLDEHGELHSRTPEYNRMSNGGRTKQGGIGKGWYDQFKTDVYPTDQVVTNGFPSPPPRYYDKLLEREQPALHTLLKRRRAARSLANRADNTPRRLADKEKVQAARTTLLKRTIT